MRRAKLIWIAVLTPTIAIVLLLGYMVIALDEANHTDEIASAILFGHDKNEDAQAFRARDELNIAVLNAALSRRFQLGSDPSKAQVFFEELGANCESQTNKVIFCKLQQAASIPCSTSLDISLEVGAESGLKAIDAKERSVCL
ncbi:hypothetical protein [Methylomonas sp. TEB]|uniref:hypothetical protein n=1 Tax=Methylomonas sp. TEB TaxID=3398229 RepID=UPI0039F4F52F